MNKRQPTEELIGNIYDIQKFSVHDGPGIRTDVFLKGCPLSCLWCHSPESQTFGPDLAWMEIKCVGIEKDGGPCLSACPSGAISPGKTAVSPLTNESVTYPEVDRTLCTGCLTCTTVCPSKALYDTLRKMRVEDVVSVVAQDRRYYEKSGGGVTISGGEPMSQFPFTLALAKRLKEEGFHVALDTTGFAPFEQFQELMPFIDLFLYDLKHMDSEKSRVLTGVPNERILENAGKIAAAGGIFQIRYPVIPTCNDDAENVRKTAEFCKELSGAVDVVQILPYHRLGATKYARLGLPYPTAGLEAPPSEQMEGILAVFKGLGLPAKIG